MSRHFIAIALALGASLLLGYIPLEAAAPSFVPRTTRETVLFTACSAEKNAARKKEREERLRKRASELRGAQKNKPGYRGGSQDWRR